MNEADEVVAKICYTLENLIEKYDQLQQTLDDLQSQWLFTTFWFDQLTKFEIKLAH